MKDEKLEGLQTHFKCMFEGLKHFQFTFAYHVNQFICDIIKDGL